MQLTRKYEDTTEIYWQNWQNFCFGLDEANKKMSVSPLFFVLSLYHTSHATG
jgi:hypothetical protein